MQLLVFVIDAKTDLGQFLADLAKMGLKGGTVLESQDMKSVLKDSASSLGIRHLMARKEYNNTIFSVVTEPELIERAKAALKEGQIRGKGVAFHCPVVKTLGLAVSRLADEPSKEAPTLDLPVAVSSWEIDPHPARWVGYQGDEIRIWVKTDYHEGHQLLMDLAPDLTVAGVVHTCALIPSGFEIKVRLPRLTPAEETRVKELARTGATE